MGWVGIKLERLPNFCYWCGRVSHSDRDCEKWLDSKGRLRKEDQEYGEWIRVEFVRGVRKTVAVIPGTSRRQAPWKKQPYVPKQPGSSGDVRPMQNVPDDGRGMATHREGSVSDEVESIQRFSPVVEVGQKEKLSSEIMHEDRLDRGIVGLTISESEATQAPRVEQDCQAPSMAQVVQADALNGSPSSSPGPTLFTKAWKRLAREVGKATKDKTSDNGVETMANPFTSGRKRMSIDIEDQSESKKVCMDICKGEEEQTFEVVAARQRHRAL